MFILCFEYFPCIIPYYIDISPPVCPLILLCTAYATSIHVYRSESVSAPIILLSFIIFFTYVRPLFNFFQSSTSLLVTLIVRKDTNVSRSGRPRFTICKSFAVTLGNFSFLFSSNSSASSFEKKWWFCAGEVTYPSSYSPKPSMVYISCSSISIPIFCPLLSVYSYPYTYVFFLLLLLFLQSFYYFFQ